MLPSRLLMAARNVWNIQVPSGLIIPFNGIVVPSGWSRFTAMDGKHPVGAGSTYPVKSTGGAQCSISRNSSLTGAHTGNLVGAEWSPLALGSDFVYYSALDGQVEDGDHLHVISAKYDKAYQQLVLIKASSNKVEFPANGIVLSASAVTPVAGLAPCYDSDRLLRSGATLATGGGFSSQACSSSGLHQHGFTETNYTAHETAYSAYNGGWRGAHVHDVTMAIADEELKKTYLAAWTAAIAFAGASGIIAMWEGTQAPYGWKLCDGTNGSIDLRDYFIILSSAGNAGVQDDEANRISVSASLDSYNWEHDHYYATVMVQWLTANHDGNCNDVGSHSHTSVTAWHDYTPPYYALTFIQKI